MSEPQERQLTAEELHELSAWGPTGLSHDQWSALLKASRKVAARAYTAGQQAAFAQEYARMELMEKVEGQR